VLGILPNITLDLQTLVIDSFGCEFGRFSLELPFFALFCGIDFFVTILHQSKKENWNMKRYLRANYLILKNYIYKPGFLK
jgi:hypothetical protein